MNPEHDPAASPMRSPEARRDIPQVVDIPYPPNENHSARPEWRDIGAIMRGIDTQIAPSLGNVLGNIQGKIERGEQVPDHFYAMADELRGRYNESLSDATDLAMAGDTYSILAELAADHHAIASTAVAERTKALTKKGGLYDALNRARGAHDAAEAEHNHHVQALRRRELFLAQSAAMTGEEGQASARALAERRLILADMIAERRDAVMDKIARSIANTDTLLDEITGEVTLDARARAAINNQINTSLAELGNLSPHDAERPDVLRIITSQLYKSEIAGVLGEIEGPRAELVHGLGVVVNGGRAAIFADGSIAYAHEDFDIRDLDPGTLQDLRTDFAGSVIEEDLIPYEEVASPQGRVRGILKGMRRKMGREQQEEAPDTEGLYEATEGAYRSWIQVLGKDIDSYGTRYNLAQMTEQAREPLAAAANAFSNERERLETTEQEIAAALPGINEEIARLQADLATASGDERDTINEQIADLESMRDADQTDLEAVRLLLAQGRRVTGQFNRVMYLWTMSRTPEAVDLGTDVTTLRTPSMSRFGSAVTRSGPHDIIVRSPNGSYSIVFNNGYDDYKADGTLVSASTH